jgi:hypothetical protein
MSSRQVIDVDPATLHLPGSRRDGADPVKLQRQFARHGLSIAGMPPLEVSRGTDGHLVINDGVTRATRVAKHLARHDGSSRSDRNLARASCRFANDKGAAMTNDQIRAELLEALGELGRFHPNWRLGQMLANVAMVAGRLESSALWDLEDEEALRAVQKMLQEHEQAVNA